MRTNGSTVGREVAMMHEALDKVCSEAGRMGVADKVSSVTLHKRFNGHTGMHVHGTAKVRLVIDVMVTDQSTTPQLADM